MDEQANAKGQGGGSQDIREPIAQDRDNVVHLPDALRAELEEALAEADREDGISSDALLEQLRRYG